MCIEIKADMWYHVYRAKKLIFLVCYWISRQYHTIGYYRVTVWQSVGVAFLV